MSHEKIREDFDNIHARCKFESATDKEMAFANFKTGYLRNSKIAPVQEPVAVDRKPFCYLVRGFGCEEIRKTFNDAKGLADAFRIRNPPIGLYEADCVAEIEAEIAALRAQLIAPDVRKSIVDTLNRCQNWHSGSDWRYLGEHTEMYQAWKTQRELIEEAIAVLEVKS